MEAEPQAEAPRRVRVPFDRGVRITHPVEPPEPPPQPPAPSPSPLPPDRALADPEPDEPFAPSGGVEEESTPPASAEPAAWPEPDVAAPDPLPAEPVAAEPVVAEPVQETLPSAVENAAGESEQWGFEPFPEFSSPSWDSVGTADAVAAEISDVGLSDLEVSITDALSAEPKPEPEPPAVPVAPPPAPDFSLPELEPWPEPDSPAFGLPTPEPVDQAAVPDSFELPEPPALPVSPPLASEFTLPELQPWPDPDPVQVDQTATPDAEEPTPDTFELPEPEPEPEQPAQDAPISQPQPSEFTLPELEPWPEPDSPAFGLPTPEPVDQAAIPDSFELPETEPEPPAETVSPPLASEFTLPEHEPWTEPEPVQVDQTATPDAEEPTPDTFELPEPEAESEPEPEPEPEPEQPANFEPWPEPDSSTFDLPADETVDETVPDEPGPPELDDVELRAAKLLEAVAAKRSRRESAERSGADAAPPTVEPSLGPEMPADVGFPDGRETLPDTAVPDGSEMLFEAETTPSFTDTPVDAGPPIDDTPSVDDHLAAPSHEVEEPTPPAEAAQDILTTERASKRASTRKLALPPWQMPSAALPAEFERFGAEGPLTAPDDFTPASEQRPEAPRRHHRAPAASEPPPPMPPPGWVPPGAPGSHGPPPVPFPPPPWWPPPPPGMPPPPPVHGHAPPQPPAQEAAVRPAPEAAAPPPPGWVPPPNAVAPPPNYRPPQAFRVPPSLDEAELADPRRLAPQGGWRRAVHLATSGHVNLGQSRKERQQEDLLAQIRQPIVGDFRIAVLSIKGGVGKTTTTLGLGSALAMVRHDRVIAVDANPDRGTLAERVPDNSTRSTVRDLLSDPHIHRYADVRNHTLMATSRLEVLASEQDPEVSEVFGDTDYRRTVDILRHFYNIILTDCGTGIMHSAMPAILDLAHTIVLVSSPAMDAARSASATLDWLMQHGHSGLVREAHVVLSASRPGSAALKLDKLYEHFETRCRSVHLIPFDPHLGEGADVDFGLLKPATMDAYLDLAGAVAENFGRLRAPREQG